MSSTPERQAGSDKAAGRPLLCLIILSLFLAACRQDATPPPSPEEITANSAQVMKSLPGFHFIIERDGAPAYLDYAETLNFRRAEGDFVSPDRAHATIRIIAPGLVAEISIIGIGENYWETNLLTGEWIALPPGTGFNPAIMFDPQIGFQPILESDLSNLQLLGTEELEDLPGIPLYALTGTLAGERLWQMSYEMIGPETMSVQMWIEPESYYLYRVIITEPSSQETASSDPPEPTTRRLTSGILAQQPKSNPQYPRHKRILL